MLLSTYLQALILLLELAPYRNQPVAEVSQGQSLHLSG